MIEFNAKKRIVWIASYPRSGNTWARAFLFSLFHVFRNDALSSLDLSLLDAFAVPDTALHLFKKHLRFPPSLVDRKTIAALRPKVMEEVARGAQGVVLVKTHSARIEDHGTPFIDRAVTAGGVYVVRNPLDVAVSFAAVRGIPIDMAIKDMANRGFGQNNGASSVYATYGSWSGNVKSWLDEPDPTILVARYEDMRDDPDATFSLIASHLRMWPSPEQLRHAIGLVALAWAARRPSAAADGTQWGSEIAAAAPRRWQDVLTSLQMRQIVADHGKQMERLGYLP